MSIPISQFVPRPLPPFSHPLLQTSPFPPSAPLSHPTSHSLKPHWVDLPNGEPHTRIQHVGEREQKFFFPLNVFFKAIRSPCIFRSDKLTCGLTGSTARMTHTSQPQGWQAASHFLWLPLLPSASESVGDAGQPQGLPNDRGSSTRAVGGRERGSPLIARKHVF